MTLMLIFSIFFLLSSISVMGLLLEEDLLDGTGTPTWAGKAAAVLSLPAFFVVGTVAYVMDTTMEETLRAVYANIWGALSKIIFWKPTS